jgi:glycosyltransferase involved in cell wall biosynthesis
VAATPLATFDPSDPASIAAVVGDLLVDGPRRAEVAAAQAAVVATSAWDAVAGRVLEAVDRMVAERPASATAASPTRHLLVAAPVLPDGGGIGAYTTRLLAEATTGDDGTGAPDAGVAVTVVADHPLPPSLAAGCRRVHPDLVGTDVRPASFDATVYALGNSDGHLGRVQLALRHPGWLWLHEARLPALATRALRHLDDDAYDSEMRRLLARAYPGRAPWPAARRAGRNEVALAEAGVGLAGLLAERSTGILVNSEVARRLVLLDLPPGAAHPPVRVLPLMCPAVDVEAHPTAGGDAGLVTFGIVSMPKQPDLLVDVAALLECPLRFVGPCPPVLRQLIDERAAARGIGAHVTVTGEVDDAGWAHWMRQATVAVQLRSGSSGESSAALLDALASGTPVATSLLSAVDLPEGVVRTVAATDAEALAADLAPLLASPAARLAQSEAGLRFARQHQAQDLLAALLAAVTA